MPIYEYNCSDCGQDSEILVRSEETDISCRSCGSGNVQRKLSAFAFSTASVKAQPACAPFCTGPTGAPQEPRCMSSMRPKGGGGFEQGACGSGGCCGSRG